MPGMSNDSPRCREVKRLFALRNVEGLTYRQLSEYSGIPAGTLNWWAHRLRHEVVNDDGREHGINPLLYLRDVLFAVSSTPASKVATLTPREWKAREGEQQRLRRSRDAVARAVQSLAFRA